MSHGETIRNLGLGQAALQSSFSVYSNVDDPIHALSGTKTGSFNFHTGHELNPWWMVDLGATKRVKTILIYNRGDGAQSRIRHLSVQMYDMAIGGWKTIYLAENEFGGLTDGRPLRLEFGSRPKSARYIKIEIVGLNILHLDQVEIFGSDSQLAYRHRMALIEGGHYSKDWAAGKITAQTRLGAIVALVRGYDDITSYDALILRNKAIFEKINSPLETQYPVIIFHEGNILQDHQAYILSKELNSDLQFVDVSEEFKLRKHVDPAVFEEHWPTGYRLMCKFNTSDIWCLTAKFRYILRIDEDCIIEDMPIDPFVWMDKNDLDCGFSLLINDSHDLTNESLPSFVEAFLDSTGATPPSPLPLTSRFPYTNLMIASTSFFRSPMLSYLISCAISEPDFYIKRWGDHILLGVGLNLYSTEERIRPIPGLRYHHESHSLLVTSNDDLRKTYKNFTSKNGKELIVVDDLVEQERILLAHYKDNPLNTAFRSRLIEVSRMLGRFGIAERLQLSFSP